ncbi:MAG: START domain-containing protein [Chitinophagaceae bacterium]
MMERKRILLNGFILLFCSITAKAQQDWQLKQDKEGIKVYTRLMENSPLKAVKTVCTINTSLSVLTAVLLDIKNTPDWVYATKSINVLKQISPSELIYYSEIQIPWPVSNRDFIVLLEVTQDPKTKAVSVIGYNKPDLAPEVKSVVRIKRSYSKWLVTPLGNGQVKIEYVLEVDPGGTIPAWLINMFATKGPFETFKSLREQVKKPLYRQVSLPFIRE